MKAVYNRRDFLRHTAAAIPSVLSPFLFRAGRAGAETPAPRRLVIFFSPNGTIHTHFRPLLTGSSYSFPEGSVLEPLAPIKEHLVVCDGLNFPNATNHEGGMAAMLTGGPGPGDTGGQSVDQYIATRLAPPTPFPSLELGVGTSAWGGSNQTRMCYAAPGRFVTPDDRPGSVFARLFGGAGEDTTVERKRRARRLSVLDVLRGDIADLQGRLPVEERHKLEQHLQALRRTESALQASGDEGCLAPTQNPTLNSQSNDAFPEVLELQMDLLVNALSCDRTRIASLQCSHTVSPTVFTWLGHTEGHHALSHAGDENTAGVAQFIEAERWYAGRFASLVQRLKERSDPLGPGSLLDNTVVVWAKEMGDSRLHICESVPFVLAGGAFAPFPRDRALSFGGLPHNHLLVSLCQFMGLSNSTFGNPTVGSGPLPGLA